MTTDPNPAYTADADLTVNGKKVPLNTFVQGFMAQTVIGMLKSLRGVDNIETVELKISNKTKSS